MHNSAFRYCAAFTFILCIFCFLGAFNIKVSANSTQGVVNANGGINMRAEASTESEVLTVIPNKTELNILEMKSGWSLVEYAGSRGYVYNQYILINRAGVLYRSRTISRPHAADPTLFSETADAGGALIIDETKMSDPLLPKGPESTMEDSFLYDGYFLFDEEYTPPPYSSAIDELLAFASEYLGTPYASGGTSPKGFDCSGFTYYVFSNFGYSLNRTAAGQSSNGTAVSRSELQPGDLLFFTNGGSGIGHVGIYTGGGMMIHAVKPGVALKYDTIESGYYNKNYVGASRIIGE